MSKDISEVIIETPMLNQLKERVKQWVLCGFTGGVVVGYARLGKTCAIRSFPGFISDRNGEPIQVFHTRYGANDRKTIRHVFYRIARSQDKKVKRSTSAEEILDELVLLLSDAAMSNTNRRVVLVVDEAQELSIFQLDAFVDLFDELDERGVRLTLVFVANKDRFAPLADELMNVRHRFVRERFFNYVHEFHGIRSEEELRACLSFYDSNEQSPDDEKSWLERYSPLAVESGFKTVDLTNMLWRLWRSYYADQFNYDSWGMTYFNRTMSIALQDYFPQYWSKDPETLEDIFLRSLEAAGNEPTLSKVYSDVG